MIFLFWILTAYALFGQWCDAYTTRQGIKLGAVETMIDKGAASSSIRLYTIKTLLALTMPAIMILFGFRETREFIIVFFLESLAGSLGLAAAMENLDAIKEQKKLNS
jgi:hypothetical protein